MLNGSMSLDAILLVIAANDVYLQTHILEHLAMIDIIKLQSVIILQNKIDLVTKTQCIDTNAENAPIIPINARYNCNIDVICEYIVISLYNEHNELSFDVPGGSIGIGTKLDPTLCHADRLVGHVVDDLIKIQLIRPLCAELFEKVVSSRRIHNLYHLIGWCEIRKGKEIDVQVDI
ncbi:hypothetical protein I4U23_008766 [Adineta vaga]|nr:hypothetical protein I4U23_008766 [Adineta vaga]